MRTKVPARYTDEDRRVAIREWLDLVTTEEYVDAMVGLSALRVKKRLPASERSRRDT